MLYALPQEIAELYNVINVDDALPGLVAPDSNMSALIARSIPSLLTQARRAASPTGILGFVDMMISPSRA